MNDRELYEEGLLMDLAKANDRIEELEAKLAKAMELANLVVEFSDRALWKVVKEVVLELKGEK